MHRSARALAVMLTIAMVASVLPIGLCGGGTAKLVTEDLAADAADMVMVKDGMTVSLHKLTADDVDGMRASMGVKDPTRNYNVLVDGMGTGLAPPSDSEYDRMVGQYALVGAQPGDLGELPSTFDLSTLNTFPKVGNQGSQGSCAAWAMTYYCYGAIEAADNGWTSAKSGTSSQLISPAWTYNRVNDYDHGSSMAGNGWVIEDWGVPTLATMPYNAADAAGWGNENAMREAPLHRANNVVYVSDSSTDTIKSIVQSGKPVTFALDANQYSACFSDNTGSKIISASEYSPNTPNHAQTIVGWNDSISDDETGAFRVINSWGTSWGESGFYWITYAAFAEMVPGYQPVYIEDRADYTPSMMAVWHFDSPPGRDTSFTVRLQNNNTGANVASCNYYYRSSFSYGAILKHSSYMAVDISDLAASYSSTNCKFAIEFSGGASQGTISSFRVERYDGGYSPGQATHISRQASDLPKTTSGSLTTYMAPYAKLTSLEALDATGMSFSSSGAARWVPVVHQSMNGGDALQSGDVPDGQSSRLSTSVTGPCTVEFDWKVASESGDNFVCSLDGSAQSTISGTTNWAHLQISVPSGAHTLEWSYTKNSANSRVDDCAYLDKVYLGSGGGGDVTPPQTTASLDGTSGSNGWYRSSVAVTLSASDAGGVASTNYRLNGGSWQVYTSTFTVSADGTNTLEFYSVDVSGNSEGVQSSTIKLDKVAPNTISSLSSYTVTLTPSDATSGVYRTFYRIDSGPWTLYSTPFSAGSSGQHTVEFNSTDNAGNVESTMQTVVGTSDTTPPTTTASLSGTSGQNGWYTSAVTVTLTATDSSGISSRNFRLDGGSWNTYSSSFSISSDGTHTVEYYSIDTAGNTESVKSYTVKVDATKPSTSHSVSSYTVTLTPSDATSGVYRTFYRVDSGAWVLYSSSFSAGASGQHTVQFNSTDSAGNVEVTKQVTVGSSDTTPPSTTASLSGISGQNGWYVGSVTVTLTATDSSGISSRHYRIDSGAWTDYSSAFTVSGEGTHTVEFYSIDMASNTEMVKSVTFKIDTVKPITNGSASGYSVTLSASDATSGMGTIYYRVGSSGGFSTYSSSFSAGAAGQVYTVYYYSIDRAGNTETARSMQVGTADTTPPITSVTVSGTMGGSNWFRSTVTVTLTASDDISVYRTYYRWQGTTSWSTYSSSFSSSTEGDRTLEYYSLDSNGNSEAVKSARIKIDRTAPTSSSSVSGGTVSLSSSDALSGLSYLEYRVDGGTWTTYTTAFTISPLWQAHNVEYRAVDVAGNMEGTRSRTVGADDETAPSTTVGLVGTEGSSGWYRSTVSVVLTAGDDASGVERTWYSLDGGAWSVPVGAFIIMGEGVHQLQYYSIDKAGNVESQRSLSISIDTVAPLTSHQVDNGLLSLAGTDATSGLTSIHYRFDSGTDMVYRELITIPDPYEAHTLYYHGHDQAGNTEVERSVLIPASNGSEPLPPGPPTALQVSLVDGSVMLQWSIPDEDGGSPVIGYKVLRGTASGEETILGTTLETYYSDEMVMAGSTYYYVVKANNSVGDSVASEEVSMAVVALPTAPLDLELETFPGEVLVSWSAPLSDGGLPITGYLLIRGPSPGATEAIVTLTSSTLSYTDEDVEGGKTYYYRVKAMNSLGVGPECVEASVLVPYTMGPPRSFSAQLNAGMVHLNWTAPTGSEPTAYRVFRVIGAGSAEFLADVAGPGYEDNDLTPGQTYRYSIGALYDSELGPLSIVLTVSVPNEGSELPSTPVGLSAMAAPDGITLDWNYPFADRDQLSGFKVFRSTAADMAYAAMVKELNDTTYLDKSALPGVTYYYQVRAVNAEGEGAASVSVSASRPADAESLPGMPVGLQVTTDGTLMTLVWSQPVSVGTAGLLGYRVYRSLDDDGPKLLATVDGPSYEDHTTLPGRTYRYWVAAYNTMGEGELCEPVFNSRELDPIDDPMMPQDLTARMVMGQVELAWEVPVDLPLSYKIYRGTGPGDLVLIATVDGDVRTFIDLEGGEGNYYTVTAVFDDGEGPSTPAQKVVGAGYETDLPGTEGSLLTNPLFWVALVGLFTIAFVAIRLGTRRRQ